MSYFSRKLYCRQTGVLEFNFFGIDTTAGTKFHVSVLTEEDKHIHFTMQEGKGGWEIINAPFPPECIMNFESKLSEAIKEELKEFNQVEV
jgi:hypothetical protein